MKNNNHSLVQWFTTTDSALYEYDLSEVDLIES